MNLSCDAFMTLFEQLNEDTTKFVTTEILKKMTYEELINHPVLMGYYKKQILPHISNNNDYCLHYLISNTKSSKLIKNLFNDIDYLNESLHSMSRFQRYYTKNKRIVMIHEYWNSIVHFDLSNKTIKPFNFQKDIIDNKIFPNNIYMLTYTESKSNPDWAPNTDQPQMLFKGQKEVLWELYY